MVDNREFASKGDVPTKPVKGRKIQEENANHFCRFSVNLIIKFGNFQKSTKYISTENLFKTLHVGHAKREGKTLAELCSETGLTL